jgi:hypothetical protein
MNQDMTTKNGTVIINGTEYIPAKEAEVGFLIALIGIVTGIILGFFVLKLNYGNTTAYSVLPESKPIIMEESGPVIPVDGPDAPMYDFSEDMEAEQGMKDITI